MNRLLRSALFTLCGMFIAQLASAQTANPNARLAWTQTAPDLATAQTYVYKHYDDGATTGSALTPVTCTDQTPVVAGTYDCTAPFPAETPGAHSMTATAANVAGESLPSTPLAFTFVVVPNPPRNLRIVSGN